MFQEQNNRFDPRKVRETFPIFEAHPQLVYLDNAATTHKPEVVIDAVRDFYERQNANVERGVYDLSAQATAALERVRSLVANFIGGQPEETVFTSGTTDSINQLAQSWGRARIRPGDNIVVSQMAHHANLLPWQRVAREQDAQLRFIPVTERGELVLDELSGLIDEKTACIAVGHISNSLGTINPVREIVNLAGDVPVFVDGAQAVAHMQVDVEALGCAAYAFSGHKLFGPTGVGALWMKRELLDSLPPQRLGGGIVREVTLQGATFCSGPHKFEAGTPNIAGIVGLGAAIEWLLSQDRRAIAEHESHMIQQALKRLRNLEGVKIVGEPAKHAPIVSFIMNGIHPHDIGTILDESGVAVRTGQHCTQPLMRKLGVAGTVRVSLACYNTSKDIDQLLEGLNEARKTFL